MINISKFRGDKPCDYTYQKNSVINWLIVNYTYLCYTWYNPFWYEIDRFYYKKIMNKE